MVSVINLTLGGLMTLLGLAILVSYLFSRIRCTVSTTATVKTLKAEPVKARNGKQYVYRPKFVYKVQGIEYEGVAPFRSNDPKKYRKGDRFSIAYNPKHPGEICFRGKQSIAPFGLGFFAAGGIFLLIYFIRG